MCLKCWQNRTTGYHSIARGFGLALGVCRVVLLWLEEHGRAQLKELSWCIRSCSFSHECKGWYHAPMCSSDIMSYIMACVPAGVIYCGTVWYVAGPRRVPPLPRLA